MVNFSLAFFKLGMFQSADVFFKREREKIKGRQKGVKKERRKGGKEEGKKKEKRKKGKKE